MKDISVANLPFSFAFAGKTYEVKKANLAQVIEFQRKSAEIGNQKDAAGDLLMVAYAIFLILNGVDKNVTEQDVLENTSGDIDVLGTLADLGFMSQQKVEMVTKLRNALETPSGTKSSE